MNLFFTRLLQERSFSTLLLLQNAFHTGKQCLIIYLIFRLNFLKSLLNLLKYTQKTCRLNPDCNWYGLPVCFNISVNKLLWLTPPTKENPPLFVSVRHIIINVRGSYLDPYALLYEVENACKVEKSNIKLSYHSRFQRAFTACVCVFKVITLVWANKSNYFENANACSKRTLKTTVSTQLNQAFFSVSNLDPFRKIDINEP